MMELTSDVLTDAQRYYSDFMIDVLVYTVVLNLFVEYVEPIVINSFTVSLLAAVVLKLMVDLITRLVKIVGRYFGRREGRAAKLAGTLSSIAILFFSKFAILLVIEFIFEEDVDLGGFFYVMVLVVAMMVARWASIEVLKRLGRDAAHPI